MPGRATPTAARLTFGLGRSSARAVRLSALLLDVDPFGSDAFVRLSVTHHEHPATGFDVLAVAFAILDLAIREYGRASDAEDEVGT